MPKEPSTITIAEHEAIVYMKFESIKDFLRIEQKRKRMSLDSFIDVVRFLEKLKKE